MSIKDGFCQTDTDGLVYKIEDTYWLIWPDHETGDPGVLDFKPNCLPADPEDYEDR